MSNRPRPGVVFSVVVQGILAALVGMTLGCSASSPTGPAPTAVTSAPIVTPAAVAPGVYTIAAGTNTVAPGEQLSVSWTTSLPYVQDWISLFKKGAPNTAPAWSQSTGGTTSGTFTLSAPTQAGEYEFRYLLEDLTDAARSSVVTVGGGA